METDRRGRGKVTGKEAQVEIDARVGSPMSLPGAETTKARVGFVFLMKTSAKYF